MSCGQQRSRVGSLLPSINTAHTNHWRPTNPQAESQADGQVSDLDYESFIDPLTGEPSIVQDAGLAVKTPLQVLPVNTCPAAQSVSTVLGPVIHHAQITQHKIEGLNVWTFDIPSEIQNCYGRINNRLRTGIRDYLTDKNKPTALLALGLRLLGTTENTPQPYIMVFCHRRSRRRAEKYVQKPYVRQLWQSDSGFKFSICVDSSGLERTALEAMGGVTDTSDGRSGCVTIEVLSDETSSFATLGGGFFLHFSSGTPERYELTANHVFSLTGGAKFDDDASSSSDSDSSEWSVGDEESNISTLSMKSSGTTDSQSVCDTIETDVPTALGSNMPTVSPQD